MCNSLPGRRDAWRHVKTSRVFLRSPLEREESLACCEGITTKSNQQLSPPLPFQLRKGLQFSAQQNPPIELQSEVGKKVFCMNLGLDTLATFSRSTFP
jgi:hypothetical protein